MSKARQCNGAAILPEGLCRETVFSNIKGWYGELSAIVCCSSIRKRHAGREILKTQGLNWSPES